MNVIAEGVETIDILSEKCCELDGRNNVIENENSSFSADAIQYERPALLKISDQPDSL